MSVPVLVYFVNTRQNYGIDRSRMTVIFTVRLSSPLSATSLARPHQRTTIKGWSMKRSNCWRRPRRFSLPRALVWDGVLVRHPVPQRQELSITRTRTSRNIKNMSYENARCVVGEGWPLPSSSCSSAFHPSRAAAQITARAASHNNVL